MSIILDIDGTIADNLHRQNVLNVEPKDWDLFFSKCHNDLPIWPVVELVQLFSTKHSILMVTGRSEKHRGMTTSWLMKYDIPFDALFMRADGDYRPDHEIKEEILITIRKIYSAPILAIDDRQSVVDMWRKNGIICLQNEPKYC